MSWQQTEYILKGIYLGLLLFALTFLLNVLGDAFVRRTRQVY